MDFTVGGLSGDEAGEGVPVVLLHGLTATRRYVVHGSRALERADHRVVRYDARGHGRSRPGDGYGYEALAGDLEAVLDDRGIDAAVLAGASMGAHTIAAFALRAPERVRAAVLITPAFDPEEAAAEDRWTARAAGLRDGGVDGFLEASRPFSSPEKWHATIERVIRQRLGEHDDLAAVADALEQVPRSRPFEHWDDLARLDLPVTVVASRDEADPEHPYAVGRRYAQALPRARLVSEEPGASPLAWQGGQLSRIIAEAAA
jgi:pimeloyl-ACP methyl ester carboxylesterase